MKTIEILRAAGVFPSDGEARKLVSTGAIKINGHRAFAADDFDPYEVVSIEVGKKQSVSWNKSMGVWMDSIKQQHESK